MATSKQQRVRDILTSHKGTTVSEPYATETAPASLLIDVRWDHNDAVSAMPVRNLYKTSR